MNAEKIMRLATMYSAAVAATEGGQPSGHLYANVALELDASLDEHTAAVTALKRAGLVAENAHLITWAGPEDLRLELAAVLEG